jgi:hypothetical protein
VAGLVAAYSFDEGSGTTVADASGNGNTGTISNATWVQGKYGNGLQFTGATNSYVSVPDAASLDLTTAVTLEAWVNPSSLASPGSSDWCAPIAKDHPTSAANDISYALYAAAGTGTPPAEHVLVSSGDKGVSASSNLALNAWTFLASTYDGANLKIYVNGTLITSKAQTGQIVEVNAPLKIGGDWDSEMFTGVIDEVRVYNMALTQAQIQTDMNTPIDGLPPTVSLTAPAAGSTVSGTAVTVSANASSAVGVANVQFLLDGSNLGAAVTAAPYQIAWDSTTVSNGTHTLGARVTDASGNTATASESVTVNQNTPLTVSITSPANNSTFAGTLLLSANASDTVTTVSSVQFSVDGTKVGSAITAPPYQVNWDSTSVTDGTHTISATATDANGNTANSSVSVQTVNGGVFGAVTATPVVAINLILMHTGKLLLFEGQGTSAQVFDPATGTFTAVPLTRTDLWCAADAQLPDGRIFVPGGHNPAGLGSPMANLFDPATDTWTALPNMAYPRWYPTATTLPDGRMLVTAGDNTSDTDHVPYPEVYNPVTNSWTTLTGAYLLHPSYPHMFVLPGGQVAATGSSVQAVATYELNVATQTWTTVDPTVVDGASSVMYRPGLVMKEGTASDSGVPGSAAATTYTVDLTQPNPSWQQTASMHYPRATNTNLVIQPDGNVMIFGGSTSTAGNNNATAVLPTELWNAATKTWKVMASLAVPRMYHSTAVLLPDGRIMTSGQGGDAGLTDELSYQMYSPPYLYYQGGRPSITSVSASTLAYGGSFTVTTPDAASISSVVLIRPGATTHGFDEDQRYVPLTFSQSPGGLTVQEPADGTSAPPGYYMLFLVNSKGVPSVASWVRLPAPYEDTQPPTAPTNLAASGGVATVALTWTASTDDVQVNQYNVYRSTTSGFTPSPSTLVGTSTTTAYTDNVAAGTYYYLITAQDVGGYVSSPSNQATGTSQPDTTPPTATMTSPANGATVSGTVAVAANATDDVAVASVQFVLDGTNYGSPLTTAPYSFSWNSATVANGTHTWAATATDTSGNTATSATITVTVNNASLPGLVASYGLDEGSGTTVHDSSTKNNNGTVSNATWTAGYYGNALQFSGATNSDVTVNDSASLDLTTGLTLEAWVNPSTLSSPDSDWVAAVAKEHRNSGNDVAYALYAATGAATPPALHLLFGSTDVGLQGSSALPLNTWTFLTGTYDGSTMKLYVGGTLVASQAHTGSVTKTTDPLRIGGDWSGEMFTGVIDNVRIYNRALSASEIQSDMTTAISARPLLVQDAAAGGGGDPLTPSLLAPVVHEAIARWHAAGVSDDRLQVLADVKLTVADVPRPYLGMNVGDQVWLSRKAAGYGWFTDPGNDRAFAAGGVRGMDLLTAVMHEFGHILGMDRAGATDAMAAALPPATRRNPAAEDFNPPATAPLATAPTWQAAEAPDRPSDAMAPATVRSAAPPGAGPGPRRVPGPRLGLAKRPRRGPLPDPRTRQVAGGAGHEPARRRFRRLGPTGGRPGGGSLGPGFHRR